MVAEYSTNNPQTPKVSYLTSDHLGSPRITTDKDGEVYTRRDFMPFGEEIDVNHTSQRKAELNYASDEIRQKFTGYERDEETDLEFAQARYYSKQHGRFITVDPLMASAVVTVSQSWNRYSYALNNPLKYTDPTGETYEDLTKEQKRVFRTYVDEQNKDRETALSAEDVYNGLEDDQRSTFESVTHALENTQLTDKEGNAITDENGEPLNALNLVSNLNAISGNIEGDSDGRKQFRLLVDLKQDSLGILKKSKEFSKGKSGHIYKDGKVKTKNVKTFREGGGPPGIQVSYSKGSTTNVDIDVDYRGVLSANLVRLFKGKNPLRHLNKTNSDVRHGNNLKRHNKMYGKENPLRNIPQKK